MVSEMQDAVAVKAAEVWIPDFGLFDTQYIDERKKYQGRLYRLPADKAKSIAELVGFTATYESSSIHAAVMDLAKTESRLLVEIERNTKPTDLNLRYMRDRWSTAEGSAKERDSLKPWIKTSYIARFLPEKVFAGLADHLRMKQEDLDHFYIRINLKDKLAGLIAEDQYVEQFPAGAYQVFALPEGHVAAIPVAEVREPQPETEPAVEVRESKSASQEAGARYATYSKSEIDRMLKMQADNITNTLSAKIGGQQRIFQDAVAAQEKNIAKITDKFLSVFDDNRAKMEGNIKTLQESNKSELELFRSQLSKELEQFRAHVNKNIIPVSKVIEEKVQGLENLAGQGREELKPTLIAASGLIVAIILVCTAVIYFSVPKAAELSEMKSQLARVTEKLAK